MIRPTTFEEQNAIAGELQKEYINLPAYVKNDKEGTVIFCWKLDWKDRIVIILTGKLWHKVMTFGTSLQPQLVTTSKPKELL